MAASISDFSVSVASHTPKSFANCLSALMLSAGSVGDSAAPRMAASRSGVAYCTAPSSPTGPSTVDRRNLRRRSLGVAPRVSSMLWMKTEALTMLFSMSPKKRRAAASALGDALLMRRLRSSTAGSLNLTISPSKSNKTCWMSAGLDCPKCSRLPSSSGAAPLCPAPPSGAAPWRRGVARSFWSSHRTNPWWRKRASCSSGAAPWVHLWRAPANSKK
mmetsp:Transcript_21166/g.61788  ORF Transcript_21166/g.61788 Transcript_21166/m.61788 type:complete len:217 (-) Transcript_21166:2192-2842(-)